MLNFLPNKILKELKIFDISKIYELRIRIDKPLYINYCGQFKKINLIITEQNIQDIFLKACSYSVYAHEESIKQGFITTDLGVRIGIAGEYVYKENKINSIKNITSLVIRVPHQIIDSSKKIQHLFSDSLINLFIVSPPGLGKTTMLKDISRYLSLKEKKVVVIDEKNELYFNIQKEYFGNCIDVLKGIKKSEGINFAIKNLNPDVIVLDELSTYQECKSVFSAVFSGVNVICTTHSKNFKNLKNKPLFYQFIKNKTFDYYVFLGDKIGQIKEIIDVNGKNCI